MQIFKCNVNYTWRGEGGVTKNACARAENMPFAHGQEKCISIFSEYPPTHDTEYGPPTSRNKYDTKYEYSMIHHKLAFIQQINIITP